MVLRCGKVTNMGEKPAVVCYGQPPNDNGPSGNGYSVLLSNFNSIEPNRGPGATLTDALRVEMVGGSRLTWRIYDVDWKLYVYVAIHEDGIGGTPDFNLVGYIDEVVGYNQFFLWIGNGKLAISTDAYVLASAADGKKYRFFTVTQSGITSSDDPATLLDAI